MRRLGDHLLEEFHKGRIISALAVDVLEPRAAAEVEFERRRIDDFLTM